MGSSASSQRLFQITVPPANRKLTLDTKGRATVTYTVHNVTARSFVGRAVLLPNDPFVKDGRIKIDGDTDRLFEANGDQQYMVRIDLGPAAKPAAKGTIPLKVVDSRVTDMGDLAPEVAWEMPIVHNGKRWPWKWIMLTLGAVLLVGGVVTWLAWPKSVVVPNVRGKTLPDAQAILQDKELKVGQLSTRLVDPPEADKVVDQSKPDGDKVRRGTAIDLVMGAASVTVPALVGHSASDALALLTAAGLTAGPTTTAPSGTVQPGIVFQQNPAAGTRAKTGDPVSISIAQQMVAVPAVTGLVLQDAQNRLTTAGLRLGNTYGALFTTVHSGFGSVTVPSQVQSQNPAAGASVPIGSAVDLMFPGAHVLNSIVLQHVATRTMAAQHAH